MPNFMPEPSLTLETREDVIMALADETTWTRPYPLRVWIRVGDAGDYVDIGSVEDAVDYMNTLQVGKVDYWVDHSTGVGFATPNYHGGDFVSCFWGDEDANFCRLLSAEECAYVENNLEESYL